MYQNRHLNTAFQKEKKETTMNLRKKLLDKKKKIIKFGKKKLKCIVLVKNVQGNRYIVKTKYTANRLLSLKRSNNCLTTHRLLF